MNMNIAGSGNIPSGEYEKIKISGSGRTHGLIRCISFSSSGASSGERIICTEDFKTAGSSSFSDDVTAGDVRVAGSFSCGSLTASGKIDCAGGVKVRETLKCDRLSVAGSLEVGGDVEAETAKISGAINCGGLFNAEEIEIKFERGMKIGSIGGSRIVILCEAKRKIADRLPLLSSLMKKAGGRVCVDNAIEGDVLALEEVVCPRVTGRVVAIGAGCEIDLVQYSEEIEISADARVGRTEKI